MDGAELDTGVEAVAAHQHGLVTRADLTGLGATRSGVRHRLAKRRLRPVHPTVLCLPGAPLDWFGRLRAVVLAAGPDAIASHRSAAALYEIPGFPNHEFEISVPLSTSPEVDGAIIHRLTTTCARVKWVRGIPTTPIARTLCDLASVVHPLRVERALDTCLAQRLVTVPAVWRAVDDLPARGRKGTGLIKRLLSARGDGHVAPPSALERRLLELLESAALPPPAREVDVGDADTWVGRVEFVYRDAKLLVEADSRLHHSSLSDRRADAARDRRLTEAGWRVLRVTWEQVTTRPHEVSERIEAALTSAVA